MVSDQSTDADFGALDAFFVLFLAVAFLDAEVAVLDRFVVGMGGS